MHTPNPIRRGIQRCLTLDRDANELLGALQDNSTAQGLLLSELIRKEAREREGRPALLKKLKAASGAGEET